MPLRCHRSGVAKMLANSGVAKMLANSGVAKIRMNSVLCDVSANSGLVKMPGENKATASEEEASEKCVA